MKLNDISISRKLGAIGVILVIPVMVLGAFLYKDKEEDIAFAKQEIRGAEYLAAIKPSLDDAFSPPVSAEKLTKAVTVLNSQPEMAALLNASEPAKVLAAQLQNAHISAEETSKAYDGYVALIATISDSSSLTLDPDMDTYYVGDMLTRQMPQLLEQMRALVATLDEKPAQAANVHYALALNGINAAQATLKDDLAKAISGNASGVLKANLAQDGQAMLADLEHLSQAAATKDEEKIRELAAKLESSSAAFNTKLNNQLIVLLNERIGGLHALLIKFFSISLSVTLVGFVLAWWIVRGITRPLGTSVGIANSLSQGNYAIEIAALGRKDEVGKLANALNKIKTTVADYSGQLTAIDKSQAVIEFTLDGTIVNANENFLKTLGYTLEEIKGKHHSLFVNNAMKNSSEYGNFWSKLARGEFQAGEFLRIGKGGKQVWIQASYNPIFDPTGKPVKVVKYATDITSGKSASMNSARLKLALDTCTANVMMADAEFNICYANDSVLSFLREAEKDIQKDLPQFEVNTLIGRNIDIFHKNTAHQRNMLDKLNESFRTSIQVGGRSFNLVANPIFGANKERLGTVVEWQDGAAAGMVDAINKSQAVIEFLPDGTIANANANFLNAMGYTLEEVRGKHHSLFVDSAYKSSPEYRQFWEALNRGEAQAGEFKRLGKNAREIWINASYNPILDLRGKVIRVVKTAADITQMVTTRTENEQGMNEAVKVLTGIAKGDLTQKMVLDYKGTFGEIKSAVNSTVDKLYSMVKDIIEAAQSVNSAASEIASGSTDLSQRTEEQASSLEETAASMEEITGTVRQNSENARNANELSTTANNVAINGGKVVEEAVSAMGNIEKSSQKISDIISVIDEIAFQTNLLALNAAVEAARAGDAGKGFAVVAAEVRSLAGRSASASKEIKALINESATQVQSGAELVNQAGSTLKDIVSSVQKVASIVSEITSASAEQATGIDEINTAITQMDETTQQNAALVEENTAAAQSMVEQAQALERLMRFFTLEQAESSLELASQMVEEKPKAVAKPKSAAKAKPAAKSSAKVSAAIHSPKSANGHAHDGWEEF